MGENENEESGSFEELISGIETQMNAERLHKQAAYAVTAARIAGTVLTEAVASGVPHELSKEMAADTWNALMGFQPIILDEVESGDAVG
ncbi:hypothetical protein ACFV0H_28660 [Streptomyces erythrochromogenes]|uniref:hypothetical protein n=1 Tax=Streptomyces TaxID=1883 RepID=UPI00366675D7